MHKFIYIYIQHPLSPRKPQTQSQKLFYSLRQIGKPPDLMPKSRQAKNSKPKT